MLMNCGLKRDRENKKECENRLKEISEVDPR